MKRLSLLLTSTLGLLLAGSPTVTAAADPPATPAPAADTTTVKVVTDVNGKTETQTISPAPLTTTLSNKPADTQWRIVLFNGQTMLPDKRVSIDQKNAKVKDALKDVLDQAKLNYVFEQDIPDDAHVTLKLDNVKLATAMNAITDSAGLTWRSEDRDGKTIVRVGKTFKPAANPYGLNFPEFQNLYSPTLSADAFRNDGGLYNSLRVSPLQPGATIGPAQGRDTYKLLSPFTTTRSRETRSTFTCPNCHNQVTIVRKNILPTCTTCGRAFQPGWKVCPFDGAKRPEAKDDWKFCPICGKPIPDGTVSLLTEPGIDDRLQTFINGLHIAKPAESGLLNSLQPPVTLPTDDDSL